jgi:hypothetical protein
MLYSAPLLRSNSSSTSSRERDALPLEPVRCTRPPAFGSRPEPCWTCVDVWVPIAPAPPPKPRAMLAVLMPPDVRPAAEVMRLRSERASGVGAFICGSTMST